MKFSALAVLAIATSAVADDKLGWTGKIQTKDGGLQGTVEVVNKTTIKITGYELADASAPSLHWWGAATADEDISKGFRVHNDRVTDKQTTATTLYVALDAGKTTDDFVVFGLWCEKLSANFGQTTLANGGGKSDSKGDKKSAGVGKRSGMTAAAGVLLTAGIFVANLV